MSSLRYAAREAGRTAALSILAFAFLLGGLFMLTLAFFFLLAPVYGPGLALLIMALVQLSIAMMLGAALLYRRRHRAVAPVVAPPAATSPWAPMLTAFISGVVQGMAARRRAAAPPPPPPPPPGY